MNDIFVSFFILFKMSYDIKEDELWKTLNL